MAKIEDLKDCPMEKLKNLRIRLYNHEEVRETITDRSRAQSRTRCFKECS